MTYQSPGIARSWRMNSSIGSTSGSWKAASPTAVSSPITSSPTAASPASVPAARAPSGSDPSDSAPTDRAVSDSPVSDSVPSDSAPSDRAVAVSSVSDSVPSDSSVSDSVPADSSVSDSVPADSSVSDSVPADSSVSDSVPSDRVASPNPPDGFSPEESSSSYDASSFGTSESSVTSASSPRSNPAIASSASAEWPTRTWGSDTITLPSMLPRGFLRASFGAVLARGTTPRSPPRRPARAGRRDTGHSPRRKARLRARSARPYPSPASLVTGLGGRPRSPSAEERDDQLGKAVVQAGDDRDHHDNENQGDGCVRAQLPPGRPDHLVQFGDDLAEEQRRSGAAALCGGLRAAAPSLRGLTVRLSRHVLTYEALNGQVSLQAVFLRSVSAAGQEGLEPPTTGFGDRDSSQLSYCPMPDDLASSCLPAATRWAASPGGHAPATTEHHQTRKCSPHTRPRRTVLAWGGDTPGTPAALSRPRGGTSPTHRPLTGPEGPVRWAGNDHLAVTCGCERRHTGHSPGRWPGLAGPVTNTSP